jgi:hypothetical protein
VSTNPNSILDSVKKALGFESEYTAFDVDVIMYINATFGPLQQLGVGPDSGFTIADNTTLWIDYISRKDILGMVQVFMYMRVRMMFDPPATSYAINAIESQISQLEWRITVMAETDPVINESPSVWWDLTGLSDFPDGAITGDYGFDTDTWNFWVCNSVVASGYFWDITGLSDFPAEALVGELGIDTASGDVWKKTA